MSDSVILVVDDEFLVLRAICAILQEIGYQNVVAAQTADEALQIALAKRPHLVLMDVSLGGPEMLDGIDIAARLRDELGMPIIFVTGLLDELTLGRVKEFRPAGYITKPISVPQTRVTIELALYDSRRHLKLATKGKDAKKTVFVSYSHKDKKYFEQLQRHLHVLSNEIGIDIWDDTRLKPGVKWQAEIETALRSARIGILLISADFLTSSFIMSNELPAILKSAESDGMLMLYLLVKACNVPASIKCFQAASPGLRPLAEMSVPERERVFSSVAAFIAHSVDP